jgi:hypothetical protein
VANLKNLPYGRFFRFATISPVQSEAVWSIESRIQISSHLLLCNGDLYGRFNDPTALCSADAAIVGDLLEMYGNSIGDCMVFSIGIVGNY